MISLNATLFVQLTLFLILLFVLNKMMIRPLHRLVLEREDQIAAKKGELAAAQQALEDVAADYRRRLREAERAARGIQEGLRNEGLEQATETLRSAQQQMAEVRERLRAQVAGELERARKELKEQAEKLSFDISHTLVGRRL